MNLTAPVKTLLGYYESDNPGVKSNLARMLMHGKLGGTGKLIILPVDQGFEHGPARSFHQNPDAYDPHYHFQLAVDAGVNAYAAPIGMIEAGASTFAGQVPTILKMNSGNTLSAGILDQSVTASVDDALRLGCSAIGFTIYPGSDHCYAMIEELRELAREAKSKGLAVVVWSYPRGGIITKDGEQALDTIAYGAHMASLLGAHIIKVKLPNANIDLAAAQKAYASNDFSTLASRVKHVVQSCFNGRRIVVFSGGAEKPVAEVLQDIKAIRDGGGHGTIIGRNSFQRQRSEALEMLNEIAQVMGSHS